MGRGKEDKRERRERGRGKEDEGVEEGEIKVEEEVQLKIGRIRGVMKRIGCGGGEE